jgi:hypothetical protein
MSEDVKEKLDAYKQGYKDGYNDAVKFYVTDPMKNIHPDHYVCPVCRISGVQLSVCYNPKCPTRVTGIKPNEPLLNHQLDYSEYQTNTYRRK